MRIVFLGTADFACPSLERLIKHADIEVLGLITQPDKPVGRKQIITPPVTKVLAERYQLKVWQPAKLSQDIELLEELRALKTDLFVTAAYGQILKPDVLAIPKHGVINLHASILPKFRGPAPINWMIMHGESTVGVSTMFSDAGIDTGDLLLTAETTLGENETAAELTERLAELGADLLVKTIVSLNDIPRIKQDASSVPEDQILAPFMDRNLGLVDFCANELVLKSANPRQADFKAVLANNAMNIHNLIRGTNPWPGAHFIHAGKKISLIETRVLTNSGAKPQGEITARITIDKQDESIIIKCFDGSELKVLKVKPESKNEMLAAHWYRGLK